MKPERFKRTKSVMATSAIALVVAALVMGVSSLVLGPRSATAQHLGFDLTSGSSSFTITSSIYTTPSGAYPATSCSGTPALLTPAVTRCVVFSVHNNLKASISVQSITTALDTTNYPAPPADCSGTNLVLPAFSGSFNVTGGGDATSPGVPVELKDNGAPQNDCKNLTYHFVYTGMANYTEVYGTSTGLVSSHNPSTIGQSVTYTATVTASATSSQDPVPSSPTGTVTFKDNGATICNSVPVTSTGTTTATAPCTVNYTTTAGSPHPITASYVNTDGNFTGSNLGDPEPGGHLLDARDFHRPHLLARPLGPGSRGHAHGHGHQVLGFWDPDRHGHLPPGQPERHVRGHRDPQRQRRWPPPPRARSRQGPTTSTPSTAATPTSPAPPRRCGSRR